MSPHPRPEAVPEARHEAAKIPRRQQTTDLFNGAARGYGTVAQALSGGQYLRWRDRLVQAVARGLEADAQILDVATGTGLIARRLQETTGAPVTGIDLTRAMLRSARRSAQQQSDPFARRLVQADATRLPFSGSRFDVVTMSYLLRYVDDPAQAIRHLVAHVRPGGTFGFIEFHVPPNPVWRTLWRLHTRLVLPAGGALVGPGWWRVGRFLGPSIEDFWARNDTHTIRGMMEQAGLEDIHVETMSLGGGLIAWGRRKQEGTP